MNEMSTIAFGHAQPAAGLELESIGTVLEITVSGGVIALDCGALAACAASPDHSLALAGQVGSMVKLRVGNSWLLANLRSQKQDDRDESRILAQVDFLGQGLIEQPSGRIRGFRRGITRYPQPRTRVYPASDRDLHEIFGGTGDAAIEIGTVYPTRGVRGSLHIDPFLGRHFAILGSTGTGKSTGLALILHRICEAAPQGRILMIDPHGEYGAAFGDRGLALDVENLHLPYWLMNFAEHCEIMLTSWGDDRQIDTEILAKCLLAARMKNRIAESMGRITVDSPVPYLLSDLIQLLHSEMGRLEKPTNSAPYIRIRTRLDELKSDPRYQFLFSSRLIGDTMGEFIGRIFRLPSRGRPIAIVDVSDVPAEITSTVVAVLSRLAFDYALWSREERTAPILLVCEEAHRYVPSEKQVDGSSVGAMLSRIAKEGRKFGISLGLISQRPSDIAEGVLSQCGTIIAMRLNNERDQAFVKAAMPEGARGFLDAMPALRNRECIICGEGVSIPIRVSFDDLEEARRPASADPSFMELWSNSGGEAEVVARTVRRWRAQGR
jgi:DNA helicase HerA-like ATPase